MGKGDAVMLDTRIILLLFTLRIIGTSLALRMLGVSWRADTSKGVTNRLRMTSAEIEAERDALVAELWESDAAGTGKAAVHSAGDVRKKRRVASVAVAMIVAVAALVVADTAIAAPMTPSGTAGSRVVADPVGLDAARETANKVAKRVDQVLTFPLAIWWGVGVWLGIKVIILRHSLVVIIGCAIQTLAFVLDHHIELLAAVSSALKSTGRECRLRARLMRKKHPTPAGSTNTENPDVHVAGGHDLAMVAVEAPSSNLTVHVASEATGSLSSAEFRAVLSDALGIHPTELKVSDARITSMLEQTDLVVSLRSSDGALSGYGLYTIIDVPEDGSLLLYETLIAIRADGQSKGLSKIALQAAHAAASERGPVRWTAARTQSIAVISRHANIQGGPVTPLEREADAADAKAMAAIRTQIDQAEGANSDWIVPAAYRHAYGVAGRFGQGWTARTERAQGWLRWMETRGFKAENGDAIVFLAPRRSD